MTRDGDPGPDPDYFAIVESLRDLPATWYPALLQGLIEASYKSGTWQDGGASRFVASVERQLGRQAGGTQHGAEDPPG